MQQQRITRTARGARALVAVVAVVGLVVVSLAVAVTPAAAQEPPVPWPWEDGTGRIQGTISHPDGTPVGPGYEIEVVGLPQEWLVLDEGFYPTDGDGNFDILVPPGTYHLRAYRLSAIYKSVYYPDVGELVDAEPIVVGGDEIVSGIDIVYGDGTISGRVTDDRGLPVPGAFLAAGGTLSWEQRTDANGEYSFPIGPGTYRLWFEAPGHHSEYYVAPGSADDARAVKVRAGQTVSDVDVSLDRIYDAVIDRPLDSPANPTTVDVGDTFTYRFGVTETFPGDGYTVSQTVRSKLEIVEATFGPLRRPCAITGGRTFRCDVPAGTPSTTFVYVRAIAREATWDPRRDEMGPVSVATVRTDDAPSNNSAEFRLTVDEPVTALVVSGPTDLGTADAGERRSYVVTVTNPTEQTATGVVLRPRSGASVVFVESAAIGWWSRPCSPGWLPVHSPLYCEVGTLAPGQSRFVVIELGVNPYTTLVQDVELTATVAPDAGTGTALLTSTLHVDPAATPPDLAIALDAPATVEAGQSFDAVVAATNSGDTTARATVATFEVPEGMVVEHAGFGWFGRPCSIEASTVTCSFGSVATVQFAVVRLRAVSPGSYELDGSVAFDGVDPTPDDDQTSATVLVS